MKEGIWQFAPRVHVLVSNVRLLLSAALNARVGDVKKSLKLLEELKGDDDSLIPKDFLISIRTNFGTIIHKTIRFPLNSTISTR